MHRVPKKRVNQPLRLPISACALGLAFTCAALAACEESDPEPAPVAVTTELTVRWAILPHRISNLELTFDHETPFGGRLSARNAGGSFGAIDTPGVSYGLEIWQSRRLVARPGSVQILIPPGSAHGGEPFAAAGEVSLAAGELAGAEVRLGILRGYHIETDAYDTSPPFETDPVLPYDPVDGYTTQGFGIRLGEPALAGDRVVLPVVVRSTLGLSDRPDMNAAIPQATTWVRVDVTVLGVLPGGDGAVTRGEVAYTLGVAEYGQRTEHPHAAPEAQALELAGVPGPGRALFGITAFDLWVNVEGHHDPGCVVVQDATNFAGEPVSGPGRYLTAATVRLWDRAYDGAAGLGSARLDLHFTNSSQYHEVGNVCAGYRGEVAMLQLEDPDARVLAPAGGSVTATFEPGEHLALPLDLWPGVEAAAAVGGGT